MNMKFQKMTTKEIEDQWNALRFFKNENFIPSIPKLDSELYNRIIIPNLIRCGALTKDNLIPGKTYIGSCKNSNEALWVGDHFEVYFNDIIQKLNHFQDDDGYDLFVPLKEKI